MVDLLGAATAVDAAAALGMTVEHQTRLDHASGTIDARYRGKVAILQKQVGTVAPPGAVTTLKCVWTAKMTVARDARSASGGSMSRQIESDAILSGTRAGWCSRHSAAVAREVHGRQAELQRHLKDLAQDDHDVLRAELDRLHAAQQAG